MNFLVWTGIIVLILIIIGYAIIKYILNKNATNRRIQLTTSPILGICPSGWQKQSFMNKTVCQEPGTHSAVDRCLYSYEAGRGECPAKNKRNVNGVEYCLSSDLINNQNKQNYYGWGCDKIAKTTKDDVRITN